MNLISKIHSDYIHSRRVEMLSKHLSELIPLNSKVLDVGCGDGLLAHLITKKRDDIEIRGVDILLRQKSYFLVDEFDGKNLPYSDNYFDVVMFVDVLHHTKNPMILLKEAKRVARKYIVIKDHTRNGFLPGLTLKFMDYMGNAKYGVNLPYNYWTKKQWEEAIEILNLTAENWKQKLGLYNKVIDLFFGRNLHFTTQLKID